MRKTRARVVKNERGMRFAVNSRESRNNCFNQREHDARTHTHVQNIIYIEEERRAMPLSVHRIVILFTIAAAGVSEIKHWPAVHVKSDRSVRCV